MIQEKKNKLFVVIILFLVLCDVINAQSLCTEIDTISNLITQIELPSKYKKKKYFYDEGTFIDYYYPNGSIITLFKGALQKTPLYSNEPNCVLQSIDTINGRISYQGFIKNKVWHENKIHDLHILYMNVPAIEKEIFDHSIESVLILSK